MSDNYVGEIRMFGGTFAPQGWLMCWGQELNISEYSTLYAIISTTYGGNGITTFRLPDLRGRVPVCMGTGPGLTPRPAGQAGGSETVTLTVGELPMHQHALRATTASASTTDPAGNLPAVSSVEVYGPSGGTVAMSSQGIGSAAGGGQPHDNLQPFLAVNYIIAWDGYFPSRS